MITREDIYRCRVRRSNKKAAVRLQPKLGASDLHPAPIIRPPPCSPLSVFLFSSITRSLKHGCIQHVTLLKHVYRKGQAPVERHKRSFSRLFLTFYIPQSSIGPEQSNIEAVLVNSIQKCTKCSSLLFYRRCFIAR